MAKFVAAAPVGTISGSIAAQTYSHNKGGPYIRNRGIPTISLTPDALAAKSRMATEASAWGGITDIQRSAWDSYSLQRPVIDALGNPRHLSGFQHFVGINARRAFGGDARLLVPPITTAPNGLLSLTLNADIGTGAVELVYTGTPLGASEELYFKAAVTNSPGITFIRNLLRLLPFSAAAQASPFDIQSDVEARLGALVENQTLHVEVSVYDNATGLISQPLRDDTVVTDTV